MSYREPLPEGCPPPESVEIREAHVVFRLVAALPPVAADFDSQRRLHPGRVFAGVSECQACGVSVFAERADCVMAQKLPALRAKVVCRLRLEPGAGRIKQTGKPSHHTWWPLADFDIVGHCEQEVA
jgi:hypothetical protein